MRGVWQALLRWRRRVIWGVDKQTAKELERK